MSKTLLYFGLTLGLFVTGFLIWPYFYQLSLSQIDLRNVEVMMTAMGQRLTIHLVFAIAMGALPIIYALVEKLGKLKSNFQRITALAIVLLMGLAAWKFKIMKMNCKLELFSEFNRRQEIKNAVNFENFNFGVYLFIGFLIGGLLSIFIFRSKNEGLNN